MHLLVIKYDLMLRYLNNKYYQQMILLLHLMHLMDLKHLLFYDY